MSNRISIFPKMGLALMPLITFQVYAEDNRLNFDIAAQPMAQALLEYSEISGVKVFFSADTVENCQSPTVKGDYSAKEALKQLLNSRGLHYRFTQPDMVTVNKSETSSLTIESLLAANGEFVLADAEPDEADDRPVEQEDLTVKGGEWIGYNVLNATTATRTDTPLMELPQSIQVIPRKLLDDQQIITVSEALRNVSGVVPRSELKTPDFEPTLLRGFSSMVMVDGFYQNMNTGDQGSLVNVQQIDVLKGANATLYSGGAGSPVGGVINILSKLPKKEAFYEVGMKGGSYDFYQPYVDINQPINDNILFRVTGEYTNSESYIDVVETERYNINPSMIFTDNEATTFTLQGKFSSWEQQDYPGLPAVGTIAGNFKIDPELYISPKDIDDSKTEFYGVWGTLDHQINDIWSVTAKARYAHSQQDTLSQGIWGTDGFIANQPFTPAMLEFLRLPPSRSTWGLFNVEMFQEQDEVNVQTYATAKFDIGQTRNTFLVGGDFTEMDEDIFMDMDMGFIGSVDLTNPVFKPYRRPGPGNRNIIAKNTTYGGYVQLQSSIYDRVHLLGGVRVSNITTDYNSLVPGFNYNLHSDETRFLPNVGGVIDLTEQISLFANYSEGMRAQNSTRFSDTPRPEMSYQKEVGIKFNWDDQLTGQVAIFQIDRQNVAVIDPNAQNPGESVAKGKQRSQGIETNWSWQAMEGLSLLANYTYTDAKYKDSLFEVIPGMAISEGNKLPGVPRHSGRFWANYEFRQPILQGLSLGAGVYAQSETYVDNGNQYLADAFHSIDATLAYKTEHYQFAVSAKNLTDEDYFQRLNYYGSRTVPSQGASVYFSGSVRF